MDDSETQKTVMKPAVRAASCPEHGDFTSTEVVLPTFGARHAAKSIWSRCPVCIADADAQDKAAEQARVERDKQDRITAKLSQAAIPRRFWDRTFADYVATTPEQQRALRIAKRYADNFDEVQAKGSILIFSGRTGTGKGHLAVAACQQVMAAGHSVLFATAKELILMLRNGWGNKGGTTELETLKMLCSLSLLVIDEIGVQNGTDAERDQLFSVIDGRYRDMKPMILTTNLNLEGLKATLGERSFSRLRQDGVFVPFEWEDYRARRAA